MKKRFAYDRSLDIGKPCGYTLYLRSRLLRPISVQRYLRIYQLAPDEKKASITALGSNQTTYAGRAGACSRRKNSKKERRHQGTALQKENTAP